MKSGLAVRARRRARLIYNPSSGKEGMRLALPEVLDILEQGGLETSCSMTHGAEDARKAAAAATQAGFDVVIAAGGDGTIHEVINGIAPFKKRPTLGIIPAGTTNDLARALSLPREDLLAATQVIARGRKRPMDIAQAGERYFVNIAGCGKLTEITYDVPAKMKTILGPLAYYMKGIEKIPQLTMTDLEVEAPDFMYSGKAMLCLIANSNSVGGFEKLVPKAKLDDGLLDVVIIKQTTMADLMKLATQVIRGGHIANDRVIYFQTNRVTVRSNDKVELNLDGEYGGTLPRTFHALHRHIQVIV